jgi:hypothetical protein
LCLFEQEGTRISLAYAEAHGHSIAMPSSWRFLRQGYLFLVVLGVVFFISAPAEFRTDVVITFGIAIIGLTLGFALFGKKFARWANRCR